MYFLFPEYARYLHANLDQNMETLDMDEDFPEEYKDHWLKNLPLDLQVVLILYPILYLIPIV